MACPGCSSEAPPLPVLCLFLCVSLPGSLREGQFCEGSTFICMSPATLQSPDGPPMQEVLRNRNMPRLGAPRYISQVLRPRVPGWWGRLRCVLGEACLNSSSSACKLSLYLIPPTVISSPSLLPSARVAETCRHRRPGRRQLRVILGSRHT